MGLTTHDKEIVICTLARRIIKNLIQIKSELNSIHTNFIEYKATFHLFNCVNKSHMDILYQLNFWDLLITSHFLQLQNFLMFTNGNLCCLFCICFDSFQINLKLSKTVIPCLIKSLRFLWNSLSPFFYGLTKVIHFLDNFHLHLIKMFSILLHCCIYLMNRMSVLLLHCL